jgi:predicted ABC-type exoprotein transport system permease subunit
MGNQNLFPLKKIFKNNLKLKLQIIILCLKLLIILLSSNNYKQNNTSDSFDKSQFIARILQESCPIDGTLAERYLRQTRGISCHLSSTLKYHSNLYHSPSKQAFPAMVGVVTDFSGLKITAIHRTYLNHFCKKAEVDELTIAKKRLKEYHYESA